jgi:hypothetical protein
LKDRRYFPAVALEVAPIDEELEYGGVRVRTTATIAGALIQQVDNGFGNAITPAPMDANTRFDDESTMTLTAGGYRHGDLDGEQRQCFRATGPDAGDAQTGRHADPLCRWWAPVEGPS